MADRETNSVYVFPPLPLPPTPVTSLDDLGGDFGFVRYEQSKYLDCQPADHVSHY